MPSGRFKACFLIVVFALLAGEPAEAARRGGGTHAYLLRGIFNVSVGLDALAVKLGRLGVTSRVYGHSEAFAVADQAIADYRSGRARSIILIGHSLGAGGVVVVASHLQRAGVPVTLLVSLDPVSSFAVPGNVRRAVNYYVSGSGLPMNAADDFRGSLRNIDLKGMPGMDHMTIQSMESMHRRMIGEIGG